MLIKCKTYILGPQADSQSGMSKCTKASSPATGKNLICLLKVTTSLEFVKEKESLKNWLSY